MSEGQGSAAVAGAPAAQGAPTAARFTKVSPLLIDVALWCACIVLVGLLVFFTGKLAKKLELVVIPFIIALLLTALLQPIARRFRRLGLGRGLSATLAVLLAIAILGGIGIFVVNRANAGYPDLVTQVEKLVNNVQDWLRTGPLHIKPGKNDLGDQLVNYLKARQGEIASGAIQAGITALELLGAMVLTFFLTVFMVYDGDRIWAWIRGLFKTSVQPKVDEVGMAMWRTLSGYIRGTSTVAVVHAVAIGVTLWIVGVPLVAPLVLLVFIGSFIPLIGIIVAGALCVLVTLVAKGLGAAIVVLIVLLVEHQLEAHVLQPFVVGRHVRLHPMAIALTLAAGALIAGLPGAIFGVPFVASLNAAFGVLRQPQLLVEPATPEGPEHERPPPLQRLRSRLSRHPHDDRDPSVGDAGES